MKEMYEIVYFDDAGQIHNIDLNSIRKNKITIGRDIKNADVVFGSKKCISRIQGYLYFDDDGVRYQDAQSTNGTYIVEGAFECYLKNVNNCVHLTESCIIKIQGDNEFFYFIVRKKEEQNGWKKIAVGIKPTTIGRSSGNDIILSYPIISKKHCIIQVENGACYITDLGSKNGTKVNGKIINGKKMLKDFDIIQVQDVQLFFVNNIIYYRARVKGVHLLATDIVKVVNKDKILLNHVNLEIKSNDFIAIIGGSGAGKTTLMNAISGFDRECKGQILFNGHDLHKEFEQLKDMIGYVPQQEIIYENLTLYKMLKYTAKMKMPRDTDNHEVEKRIKEVLEMVELEQHANTYIRKLSGGQKKRASIAVELLADPKLFFLDEPTSGLDPGTEKNLMITLNKLSKTRDKTTILVTHTTQNLHLCDKVIFMGPGGYLCFYGTVDQAKMFFQTEDLVNIYNIIEKDPKFWAEQFANCDPESFEGKYKGKTEKIVKGKSSSVFRQAGVLTKRYAELMWNDKSRLAVLLFQAVIIAGLLKMVCSKDIYKLYDATQSMMFALSSAAIWIGIFNSIQEICKERAIVKREYMASMKLPVYVISKFVIQFFLAVVQALLLTGVFVLAIDKYPSGILFDNFFFEIYVTVLLTILSAMTIGLVISAIVNAGDKAMTVAPFILIIQLLFSGILFELRGVSEKIAYLTISKWSVSSLGAIVNLNDLPVNKLTKEQKDLIEQGVSTAKDFLIYKKQDIFNQEKSLLFTNWGILAGMTVVFLIITGIALINVKNDRR